MSFQQDITSDDVFKTEILETPGTVQIVELYQSWCGPCKAIVNTFKNIYFANGDKPIKFYTCNADKVKQFSKYVGNCQPVFLFFKDGQQVEAIEGVTAPELTKTIMSLC